MCTMAYKNRKFIFRDHENLGLATEIIYVNRYDMFNIYALIMLIYAHWASTQNVQQMELSIWCFPTTGDP